MILFWGVFAVMLLAAMGIVCWPLLKVRAWQSGIVLAVLLPAFVIPLYLHWGNAIPLKQYYAREKQARLVKAKLAQFSSPAQMEATLRAHLRLDPHSTQGWYLLGRLYFSNDQFNKAAGAFAKAHHLKMNNIDIDMQLTESLYFRDHRQLTGKSKQLLADILRVDPTYPGAINLLAIDAYHQGHYQAAINYWRSLLASFPSASKDEHALLAAISKAERHISQAGGIE